MGQLIQNNSIVSSMDMFEMQDKAMKFAKIIAESDIIPQHYQRKPANVFIAIQTAYRLNVDPMMLIQNSFVSSCKGLQT